MKIIVLMKQVANKDAVLRIAPDEKWINEADVSQQTNESDGYALEEALRTIEAKGEGEVVVCTLGPQTAKTVIKDALDSIEARTGVRPDLDKLSDEDPEVYRMLRAGRTIG